MSRIIFPASFYPLDKVMQVVPNPQGLRQSPHNEYTSHHTMKNQHISIDLLIKIIAKNSIGL